MADRNQLRIERDDGYADTDPLAELTRIMGFDPRVEPAPPLDDNFGIDLERELMGEFEAGLRDTSAIPEPVHHEPAYDRHYAPAEAEPFVASDVDEFDEALAASLEEEFTLDAEQWQPEAAGEEVHDPALEASSHELALEASPFAANAADAAIDMDFSGQLSRSADEPASIADEPFWDDAPKAVEIPDLEAELGELLGALGVSHDEADVGTATEGGAAFDSPYPADEAASGSEDSLYAAGEQFAEREPTAPAYDADERREYPLEQSTPAYADEPVAYGDQDAARSSGLDDEVFDEMFAPATLGGPASETALDEAEGEVLDQTSFAESGQESEIQFFADSDQEQANDLLADFSIDGLGDTPPQPVVVGAGSLDAADEQDPADYPQEGEQPIFDESEFEAALVDEFAGDLAPELQDEPVAEAVEEPQHDPFAALSSLGGWQTAVPAAVAHAQAAEGEYHEVAAVEEDGGEVPQHAPSNAASLAPEIETVEVPERAVALADDLDIPEMRFDDEAPAAMAYDDLDAQFSAFNGPTDAISEDRAAETGGADRFDENFDRLFEVEEDLGEEGGAVNATDAGYGDQPAPRSYQAAHPSSATLPLASGGYLEANDDGALVYDPAYDSGMTESPAAAVEQTQRNRGFLLAAVLAGLAFAGGVGAFAYSVGGGEDGAPALVKADNGPVKVRPENPGGAVVPNQDSKAYERVSSGPLEAPSQEKLISGAEEPVEIATRAAAPVAAPQAPGLAENLPGVDLAPLAAAPAGEPALPKADDRLEASPDIESVIANEETAAVAPRRVRTLIVRPDGTLVPREDPAPAAAAPLPPEAGAEAGTLEQPPAPALAPISATPAEVVAQPAVIETPPAAAATPAAPSASAVEQPVPAVVQGDPATPVRVPVAPSRPGDQPVDIIGEVKARGQVASLEPQAPATAAAGSWMMQIASQPSPEGAQATYENLASRYGSILSGRGVNIVKAEIAGKGTFWRVRIPASSRSDAIQLCETYKGAGGSCFVSQ